jgi:long-chain fatty acid transport protein
VKLKKLTLSLGLGVLALASTFNARADVGGFGFGSRTAALAGAGAAWGFDAYSAYANPAGLTEAAGKKLRLSYGWLFMDPKFTPIRGITIENNFTSDDARTGNVVDDYRSVLGQTIGAAALIAPDWYHLSAGITIFTPFDPLGAIDTGEPYIPEYVLYRSRTQRPILEAGLAAKLTQRLSVGLGLHIGYAITATGNAFLQTAAGTTSSMRVSASLKPKTSPNLAWLLLSETPQEEAGAWSFGQVLRTTHDAKATLNFNSSARAFGDLAALDIRFGANSALFYDPLTLETGFSWKHSPRGRLYLQADFQNWANFKRPALEIRDPTETCTPEPGKTCNSPDGPLIVNPSVLPGMKLRNTFTPRIAEEISFESSTLRVGYAYRPSMFKGLPSEAGNYIDPSKHIVSAGWGWKFPSFLGWNAPAQIDVHASYQHLVTAKVTKTAGDESGTNPTGAKIGAPGYDIGGRLWGGGATLTLEL